MGAWMRRKPTGNDWLVIGGALLWLVAFFLPWYHTAAPALSQPIGGNVAGGLRWLLFVLALATLVFGVVVSFALVEVHLSASNGLLLMLAGAVLSVATLAFAVWPPTGSSFSYGVWLSLLGALAVTYGGFASHNAESAGTTATSHPEMRWTPKPPAPQTQEPPAQARPRRTTAPPQSPQAPAAPPSAPPSQPPAPGYPQQPIPPGYPHGQGRGYGGGQGEGW